MNKPIPLGPTLTGTIVARDIDATVAAYCEYLYTSVLEETSVSETQAQLWGKPRLAGSPLVTHGHRGSEPRRRIWNVRILICERTKWIAK